MACWTKPADRPSVPGRAWLAPARSLPHLLLAITAVCVSTLPAPALAPQSAPEFVRDLYVAEAARIAAGSSLSETEAPTLFTPELAGLWLAAQAGVAETGFDEFFGSGVKPGAEVGFVRAVVVLGSIDAPILTVDIEVDGQPRRVVVDLVEGERSWHVANIVYDRGGDLFNLERRRARR